MSADDDRDHRRLGRRLQLYTMDELVGAGLPLWLPAGSAVRAALERFVTDTERRAGYVHVHTPALAKRRLYEQTGHWAHFRDDMFPPLGDGPDALVLRPMNCPHHVLVYRSRGRSHRELPLRIAELGTMFRDERSGVVGGLSRVRQMTLNDAHVFATPDQLLDEVEAAVGMIRRAHAALGISPARWRLSLRGEGGKYVADDALWARAEAALRAVLERLELPFEQAPGEAAFYGPKLDVQVRDAAGREETLSTVQVDFHLPERFDLGYTGVDGRRHRPVMVHHGVLSTMERLVAHLVEAHAGALPVWLAPVQVAVLPVTGRAEAHARAIAARLRDADVRAEVDAADRTLSARVRAARHRFVPYLAVAGDREAADGTVAVRLRDGRRLAPMPVTAFIAVVTDADRARRPDPVPATRP